MGQTNAKEDLRRYREGYPGQDDDPSIDDNYRFYAGQISSRPEGDHIDTIHQKWWGNTPLLEVHHGYIQWLFPIREHGMNHLSLPLQLHEVANMKQDPECMRRLITSYKMMLDFYGTRIRDEATGELERHENWQRQYHNLNTHGHNNLRITRILKCLGEFGYENYKEAFMKFYISEMFEHGLIGNCAYSCENFWLGTLKNDELRTQLEKKK